MDTAAMWDEYDERLEQLSGRPGEDACAAWARSAARLVLARQLTAAQALYEAAEAGVPDELVQEASEHLERLT